MTDGMHLIAGEWKGGSETFESRPLSGAPRRFAKGGAAEIDAACRAAEEAFPAYAAAGREARAAFLERIADEIEARGPAITKIAMAETGLPAARLEGERGRTTGQLRFFARHILAGAYLDRRLDPALPDRQPLPRPELRLMQRPIGPVGVFGASNFPLAFSVAGGDTAAALAAGCPVVVKGHEAHPGTSELVAQAILAAATACAMPKGVFSMVHGGGYEAGEALARHPLITAIAFTGSLRGGRALFDICAARPTPIPFFGELGSINPVFALPAALSARGAAIAQGWAGSLTMGAGQFCTNPGVVVLAKGPDADAFAEAAVAALRESAPQAMLTDGIAEAFRRGCAAAAAAAPGAEKLHAAGAEGRAAAPTLLRVSAEQWRSTPELRHEVFGPFGVLVETADAADMPGWAAELEGQLTATLQMDDADAPLARRLLPALERKAGRVLVNGFPTGVEVADAMVHGGPYPATTNFGATSVGSMAIRRFLRPVCYQNMPSALLSGDWAF